MNDIAKVLFPYLICFLFGLIMGWRGCGATTEGITEGTTEVVTIEKPVPVVEYVDRWISSPLRHIEWRTVHDTVHDTVYDVEYINVYDSVLVIDTVKIVESWLTEVVQYDTTEQVGGGALRLRWQNYQNITENLTIDYNPKIRESRYAIGIHANAGLISDFSTRYTPLFGLGLQVTVKKSYFSANYGFNGDHYVGLTYGRNIISK